MSLNKFMEMFERISTPNNFTIAVGNLVRKARLETGITQSELSRKIFARQATLSDIENGKRMLAFDELLYLSHALSKPPSFFVPEKYRRGLNLDNENEQILELALVSKGLAHEDLVRLVIQARALAKNKDP